MEASKRTAISRRDISLPLRRIFDAGYDFGTTSVLHLGCGRPDNPDRDALAAASAKYQEYDPHWGPTNRRVLRSRDFYVVIAIYVLNVLPPKERKIAIRDMALSLNSRGVAFVAVRRTLRTKGELLDEHDGYRTVAGTFQKPYTPLELDHDLLWHFRTVEPLYDNPDMLLYVASSPKRNPRNTYEPGVYERRT